MKNIEEFSGKKKKKFRRTDQQAEKNKTERVTGLGRRTSEGIAKWNQMTALRFQTGERHQTSPSSLRRSTRGDITRITTDTTAETSTACGNPHLAGEKTQNT